MGIKELTAESLGKKNKSEWRFDKRRNLWVTFQVRAEFDGAPHVRRGFLTAADAEDYLKQLGTQERLKQIGVVKIFKFPTVKKLLDAHRAKLESQKAKSAAKRIFDKFLALVPKQIKLDELRRKHFKDYADARVAAGIKAESANREIGDISAAIHKAGDYFEGLEGWSVPDKLIYRPEFETTERSRVITPDERRALVEHLLKARFQSERAKDYTARRRAGLVLYFGLLTGLRHGEISGVRKSEFDRPRRRLRAERFKTKKSGVRWTVFEPLTDTQLWVLEQAEKLHPAGEFFFSAAGKNHNKIYETLRLHCERLGIPYGKNQENGFVIHDARHTFVTVLEHGAVDSSTTRSFSGHTKEAMMKRYAHATPDSRARAMVIIEREVGLGAASGDEEEVDDLLRIYEAVRAGKISFDAFRAGVESFYGFFTENQEKTVADVADVIETKSALVQ